jgi:SnoaL-like domain
MTSSSVSSLEERIWILESERSIRDLVHRYCDSADRGEWGRFRSVFHSDSTHKHDVVFEGRSADFATLAERLLSQIAETHHQIGNVMVRVNGKEADCQCYFTAHHLVMGDASLEIFPRHKPGVDEDWWVGGRYFDRLSWREGRWGIVHRSAIHDWERWEPACTRGFRRSSAGQPAMI